MIRFAAPGLPTRPPARLPANLPALVCHLRGDRSHKTLLEVREPPLELLCLALSLADVAVGRGMDGRFGPFGGTGMHLSFLFCAERMLHGWLKKSFGANAACKDSSLKWMSRGASRKTSRNV